MARQINLAALSASGDLTVSLENPFTGYDAIEDVNSNGVTSLFDGVGGQSDPKLVLNNQVSAPGGVPKECVVLNFNTPIKAQEVRIDNIMAVTTIYNIYINAGASDTDYAAKVVKSIPYSANPTLRSADLILPGGFLGTEIRNIVVELGTSYLNNDHILSEIELYIEKEAENPNFEFNDSVLETKAWNSSRYDGRQLEGAVANEFRAGDTTYGKTPVLRNYTRNIYIGNDIVGMYEEGDPDDPTLLQFPRYAYAQTNYYITINDDDTITYNILEEKRNNNNAKNGFYRAFYKDFPIGSDCKIIINDQSVKNKLKNSYPIYFNGGQLQRVLTIQSGPNGGTSGDYTQLMIVTASAEGLLLFDPIPDNLAYGSAYIYGFGGSDINTAGSFHTASLHNEDIYTDWFTGSLGLTYNLGGVQVDAIDWAEYNNFIDNFLNFKNTSGYKGDKRLYLTATAGHTITQLSSGSQSQPVYTYEPGGYQTSSFGIKKESLADLSTIEVVNHRMEHYSSVIWQSELQFSINENLHQNYSTRVGYDSAYHGSGSMPPNFVSGSLVLSKLEDKNPSLLLPLNKTKQLPEGIGTKNFVIVPENLHPYVKDNLTYFLTRAGIDVGGNTSTLIPLNQTNKYIDRIGWKPPKPAPTPELQAAQDAKTEITFEQRRLLARQLAEQNRRRWLERLREEEENQRRNKRQSKREDRQEERKEKKQRREERKENRRENRQERREDRREDRQNRRENRRNRRRNR